MPNPDEMKRVLFAAWEKIVGRIGGVDIETADPVDRAFAAAWMLEAEVDNGGFAQYMFNSTGEEALIARAALVTLGASTVLAIFDEFVARLPGGVVARDMVARQEQLDALEDGSAFDDLEQRFYAAEGELQERLFAFVVANRLA